MSHRVFLIIALMLVFVGFYWTRTHNIEFYNGRMYTDHRSLVIDSLDYESNRLMDSMIKNGNRAVIIFDSEVESVDSVELAHKYADRALDYSDSIDKVMDQMNKLIKKVKPKE